MSVTASRTDVRVFSVDPAFVQAISNTGTSTGALFMY